MLMGLSFPADNDKDQPWGQVQQKEEIERIGTPYLWGFWHHCRHPPQPCSANPYGKMCCWVSWMNGQDLVRDPEVPGQSETQVWLDEFRPPVFMWWLRKSDVFHLSGVSVLMSDGFTAAQTGDGCYFNHCYTRLFCKGHKIKINLDGLTHH